MSAYEIIKSTWLGNSNLKGYWRFESDLTDSSGNGSTLTGSGSPTYAAAVYGNGLTLVRASSQYAYVADNASLSITGNLSLSCWIKLTNLPSTSGDDYAIINKFSSAGNYSYGILLQNPTNNILIQYSGDGTNNTSISSTGAVFGAGDVGNWVHLVVSINVSAKTATVYKNGVSQAMGAASGTQTSIYDGNANFQIGARNTTSYLNGAVDDLAIFSQLLSADQIKELYEGRYIGEWMPQSGLVGLWHLNGNSTDTSGNNNHGTDTAITYSLANGKIAQGAGFNGTTSKIVLTSEQTSTTGTFNCWFKTSGAGSYQVYSQSKSSGGDTDRISLIVSAGKVGLGVLQSSAVVLDLSTNATFNNGAWHMATWVVGAASNAIYVDGNPQAVTYTAGNSSTSKWFGTISAATDTKDIGTFNIVGSFFNWFSGQIDEVAIFSRALTAAEIRHWYAHSTGKYI